MSDTIHIQSEAIDIERSCGNCRHYIAGLENIQFGECVFPLPEWVMRMLFKSQTVSPAMGHHCPCHKLKD